MYDVSESPHKDRNASVCERENTVCLRVCVCRGGEGVVWVRTVYRISEGVFDRNAR